MFAITNRSFCDIIKTYLTTIVLCVLHYVNVFVLIKFPQKEQRFTLIILSSVINKFSIKSFVVDVYQNRRDEEILIPIRNIYGIEAAYALTATGI